MPTNICTWEEKTVRVILGVALLSLFYFLDGSLSLLGLLGLIPIATVLIGYCPLKHYYGIITCPIDTHRAHHA